MMMMMTSSETHTDLNNMLIIPMVHSECGDVSAENPLEKKDIKFYIFCSPVLRNKN